jgi:hypothetical protein
MMKVRPDAPKPAMVRVPTGRYRAAHGFDIGLEAVSEILVTSGSSGRTGGHVRHDYHPQVAAIADLHVSD